MKQDIITLIKDNCEWVFDGLGTEIVSVIIAGIGGIVGWLIRRRIKSSKNESESSSIDNSTFCEKISGDKNITGNNNTINIYQSQSKEDRDRKEKSLFSTRFKVLQKLLNDARCYNEKEYTIEYISSLVGVKNVGEMKEYVEGDKEPDEDIKQRFVDIFGVNRDWMLFNQGDCPFASNLKKYRNGADVFDNKPMDILRNERLFDIQKFIIVIGRYEHRRSVLIIRKSSDHCYELYPKVYDLDPNVGGTGKNKLVSFYRFLREADKIRKISGIVYEATEEQFKALYTGTVAPMIVRNYEVFKCFTDDFLDLSYAGFERTQRFWDKDLVDVKRIIQCDIENVDRINQEYDLKLIESNLKKKEETEIVLCNNSKGNVNLVEEYVNECMKIIKKPTIIFEKAFVDLLIEKQISLYKLYNQGLNRLTDEFCKAIQDKLNAFNEEADRSLWNLSERIRAYMDDGLIESGEIIEKVKFETQEHINNEINAYKKENMIDANMVRKHISDIYACIDRD